VWATEETLISNYIPYLIEYYVFTVIALQSLYPENATKFKYTPYKPIGYWNDIQNQRSFFDQLAIKLNIQKPEDWYHVTTQLVVDEGGSFVTTLYKGSLAEGKY
jgi:hypothetical protein